MLLLLLLLLRSRAWLLPLLSLSLLVLLIRLFFVLRDGGGIVAGFSASMRVRVRARS